ncbi:MAG: dethiobiotin synthase, partial [Planctomycetes bacterium]|nr:dethiobiotin synthase [Planctomycetota bacterium]
MSKTNYHLLPKPMFNRPPGLFVTGTDTNIGKTHIATMIGRESVRSGVRAGVYKPACSGAVIDSDNRPHWEDIDRLRDSVRDAWSDELLTDDAICPQRFLAPLAPHLAARQEGREVDFNLLMSGRDLWTDRADFLIVEGAGGFLSPVTTTATVADLR